MHQTKVSTAVCMKMELLLDVCAFMCMVSSSIIINDKIRTLLCLQPEQCLLLAQARVVMMDAVNQRTYQLQQEKTSTLMPQLSIYQKGTVALSKLSAIWS